MADDNGGSIPPRVKTAFDYLYHTWRITEQVNVSIPTRPLTALERSVETTALRVLQQYMLGEMDFAEPAAVKSEEASKREEVKSV